MADEDKLQSLIQKAESGDSSACFRLGNISADNGGLSEAVKYYQKGIDTDGNLHCLCALAEAYCDGSGVHKDAVKADDCFDKALNRLKILSDKNDAFAQFYLGVLYYKSDRHKDYNKAYDYFELCFYNCGNPAAQNMMEVVAARKEEQAQAYTYTEPVKPQKAQKVKKHLDYSGLKKTFKIIGIVLASPFIALFYIGYAFVWLISAFLNMGGSYSGGDYSSSDSSDYSSGGSYSGGNPSGYSSSNYPYNKPYEKTYNTTAVYGRGKLVQEGMHRYIQTSSGRVSVSDYDVFTGIAKGYDGKTYKIEGTITERDIEHR